MRGRWEYVKMGDVSFVTDFSANGSFADLRENVEYLSVPDYAILIRLVDFTRNWDGDFVYITKNSYNFLRKCQLSVGDVIIANIGANAGTIFKLPNLRQPCALGPNSLVIKTDDFPNTSKEFLYYYFSSPSGKAQVQSIITGSAQPKFTKTDFRNLNIPLPPLPEQRRIAGILGALDDKIELNRRMNHTLESIAQAVFINTFKKCDGKIKIGTVEEDFDLTMGQSPPGVTYNEEGEGIPFFQGRTDFGFRYPENRVYCTSPTRFAKTGDTLVSVRAPVGNVNMTMEDCAIGRGVASIRHKTGSRSYTYYAMRSLKYSFTRFEAEGTVFGTINKADFHNLEINIPTSGQVMEFELFCYPIDQLIETNEVESRTLANLRDTLLPKLMRGEVRVKTLGYAK